MFELCASILAANPENLARDVQDAETAGVDAFHIDLINNHGCALGLNTLHNTLNGALPEVVTVTFHSQSVHTDGDIFFLIFIKLILRIIAVVASQLQNAVCNKVFTSSITLNDCFNKVLRHVSIICQKLLSILRQAVSAGRCQVLDNIFHK